MNIEDLKNYAFARGVSDYLEGIYTNPYKDWSVNLVFEMGLSWEEGQAYAMKIMDGGDVYD